MSQFDQQRSVMAQRMSGATPGGLSQPMNTPPPSSAPQQTPGGAPVSSRLEPLLQQVMQILVEGNPADLEAFGKFMAQLQQLVGDHQGQGAPQGAPPIGGGQMPGGMPPQFGR
jgi:hypothetical protein